MCGDISLSRIVNIPVARSLGTYLPKRAVIPGEGPDEFRSGDLKEYPTHPSASLALTWNDNLLLMTSLISYLKR